MRRAALADKCNTDGDTSDIQTEKNGAATAADEGRMRLAWAVQGDIKIQETATLLSFSPYSTMYEITSCLNHSEAHGRTTGQGTADAIGLIGDGKRNGQCRGRRGGIADVHKSFLNLVTLSEVQRSGGGSEDCRPSRVSSLVSLEIEKVAQFLAMEPNRPTMGSFPLTRFIGIRNPNSAHRPLR